MFKLLSIQEIIDIHSSILENEQGFNPSTYDKSRLEGVAGRIENTLLYSDEISDIFQLAALYTEAFAVGHAFPDGNKRTALITGVMVLYINISISSVDSSSYLKNVDILQKSSFLTEFMVLVAEKKVTREDISQLYMKLLAGSMLVVGAVGAGYAIYKLIEFIANKLK